MEKLVLLYFGTILLAFLSQTYYPVKVNGLNERQHFAQSKTDIFVIGIILWLTLFNGLKTSYNDTGNYIAFSEMVKQPSSHILKAQTDSIIPATHFFISARRLSVVLLIITTFGFSLWHFSMRL